MIIELSFIIKIVQWYVEDNIESDLGNQQIWIGGEVNIDKNEIKVNGESNLVPETTIKSSAVSEDWAVFDFQDSADVQEDGSFSYSFPGRSSFTRATLSASSLNDKTQETYG